MLVSKQDLQNKAQEIINAPLRDISNLPERRQARIRELDAERRETAQHVLAWDSEALRRLNEIAVGWFGMDARYASSSLR